MTAIKTRVCRFGGKSSRCLADTAISSFPEKRSISISNARPADEQDNAPRHAGRIRASTHRHIAAVLLQTSSCTETPMPHPTEAKEKETKLTRKQLIEALNEDLSREYQAIIAYVNYSQVLKGAAYMNIADELAAHPVKERHNARKGASHIDYLGGMPSVTSKPVKTSEKAEDMLRFDLDNRSEEHTSELQSL